MSAGIKANNDGSAAIQVGGVDRVSLSSAGVMEVPAGIVAGLTGNVTGAADKLSTASGSAPSYSARAWVNFNGTGTVAIRASGNVSSITDNAVGQYTVNFTNAMPDVNYASACNAGYASSVILTNTLFGDALNLTGSTRVSCYHVGVGYVDPAIYTVAIFR